MAEALKSLQDTAENRRSWVSGEKSEPTGRGVGLSSVALQDGWGTCSEYSLALIPRLEPRRGRTADVWLLCVSLPGELCCLLARNSERMPQQCALTKVKMRLQQILWPERRLQSNIWFLPVQRMPTLHGHTVWRGLRGQTNPGACLPAQ